MPAQDKQGRRLALIVGSSEYRDPTLQQLRAPGRDATDLAEVLRDPAIGTFNVRTLVNTPSDQLLRGIAQFCHQADLGDLVLVYLSCHGVLDDRGRLYYATINTERVLLSATAVAANWLNEQLDDCRARQQILLLDCCHSGAFAKGSKGDDALALKDRFSGRGRVVLTASRATEYSFEGATVAGGGVRSVFTSAVVDGLRTGQADWDKDGQVTVDDLYHYVDATVRNAESRQTPARWAFGAEGDLVVAHSVRGPIIEPAPLPDDVRLLVESPRLVARESGVKVLADLLDHGEPALALTARLTLQRISEDDLPRIAALARAAHDADHGQAVAQLEAKEQARREAEQEARRQEAEEAAAQRQQQIGQLQDRIRDRAAAQDWDAVLGVSDQLAALDPAAADPDGLASAAREQITRRQEAEEAAAGRPGTGPAHPGTSADPGLSAGDTSTTPTGGGIRRPSSAAPNSSPSHTPSPRRRVRPVTAKAAVGAAVVTVCIVAAIVLSLVLPGSGAGSHPGSGGSSPATALSSASSSSLSSSSTPSISISDLNNSFTALAGLRSLARSGTGSVAVILPDTVSSARYVEFDAPYLTQAFTTAGLPSSDVTIQNAEGSDATQLSDAQSDITNGARALVVDPLDSGVGQQIELYAKSHGVAVIDYDRLTLGGSRSYYVSFNAVKVGQVMGQGLVSCISAWGIQNPNVIVMKGAPTDANATLFAQGYDGILAPYFSSGKYKDVSNPPGTWDPQTALSEFEQQYTAHKNINAALIPNDENGAPIIQYLQHQGLKPKTFPTTGQDATLAGLQNILTGYQCGTVYKPIYLEAEAAAALAIYLRAGQTPPSSLVNGSTTDSVSNRQVPSVLLSPEWVTTANMNSTIIADKFVSASQLCTGSYASACTAAGIPG
jgi:D-xylose transport system substrate-binding protein